MYNFNFFINKINQSQLLKQYLFTYYSLQFSIIKWKKEIKLLSGNGENRLNKIRNLKKEKREREKKGDKGVYASLPRLDHHKLITSRAREWVSRGNDRDRDWAWAREREGSSEKGGGAMEIKYGLEFHVPT